MKVTKRGLINYEIKKLEKEAWEQMSETDVTAHTDMLAELIIRRSGVNAKFKPFIVHSAEDFFNRVIFYIEIKED